MPLMKSSSTQNGMEPEYFARLEINHTATIKKLLLITSNPQLDELFANAAT